jgi:hypothetical protein
VQDAHLLFKTDDEAAEDGIARLRAAHQSGLTEPLVSKARAGAPPGPRAR